MKLIASGIAWWLIIMVALAIVELLSYIGAI